MDIETVEHRVETFLIDTEEYQKQIEDTYRIELKTYINDLKTIIQTEEIFISQVKLIIKLMKKIQKNIEKNTDTIINHLERHNEIMSSTEKKLEKVYKKKYEETDVNMRNELDFMIDIIKEQIREEEEFETNLREYISILNDMREECLSVIDSLRFDIIQTGASAAFGKKYKRYL